MLLSRSSVLSKFTVAGINYKKSDAAVRGMYAINKDQYTNLLLKAHHYNISEFFVLSTCNRTEIYGLAEDMDSLCSLLCSETQGRIEDFRNTAYIKSGISAAEHLFHVAAGLDSQILGDYEIVGQLKDAVKLSKKMNCINVFTDRLVNAVLQASKNIKTNTGLSGGTVSVSFAAVQYIKDHISDIADKKILLVGTGKIGRNTCKNMVDYLGTKNITLVNRTEQKAITLAEELGLKSAALKNLIPEIQSADIILVASSDTTPVILKSHLNGSSPKLIIDLSIPYNVDPAVKELPGIDLVNVDELSKIKDETLQMRLAEVPKANRIIDEHITDFIDWNNMRINVPVLKAVKTKLEELHKCNMYTTYTSTYSSPVIYKSTEEKIQKVINGMALKMRDQNQRGCLYIEAINEYIADKAN